MSAAQLSHDQPSRGRFPAKLLALLILGTFFLFLKIAPVFGLAASLDEQAEAYTLYLPVIPVPDPFIYQTEPIWSSVNPAAAHEVTLFRRNFTLAETANHPSLSIFADTRYELWIDGIWVGRGPARFAQTEREYDVYALDQLAPGTHTIAVLVQWAPNTRRSESTRPWLQAALYATVDARYQKIISTHTAWKALKTDAWRGDAAQVHTWRLLGPTELLDLRQLPKNWMMPGFDDADWPFAVVQDPDQIAFWPQYIFHKDAAPFAALITPPAQPHNTHLAALQYTPRSIQFLENQPIAVQILDRGLLSPGRAVVEIPAGTDPYLLPFVAKTTVEFNAELLLGDAVLHPEALKVDGRVLGWELVGDQRPDVYTAATTLPPGNHQFEISGIPHAGLSLTLPLADFTWENLPFSQGSHAGRRLLLADYISKPGAVTVETEPALRVSLDNLPAYFILDLGRTVHGRLAAEVSGPAGTVVDMGWDERLYQGTRPLPFPGSFYPYMNQVDSWVLDGSQRVLSTLDARAGRYLLIAVWGTGPVVFEQIQVFEERYPVTQTGSFVSADPQLNRIWQVGVDTLYPTMNDAYADPWRERGQWWGDAYVGIQANAVAFGDTELLRRGLRLMAGGFENGRPTALAPHGADVHMLDYGMLWLHSLADYALWTADEDLVSELFPTVQAFMDYLANTTNETSGLIDLPVGPWSETAYIDTYGYHNRFGQSTALNAMYAQTLERAAELADGLGDSAQANLWRTDAQLVSEMINELLYLPAEQRYVTSILDGEIIPPSPYAQAWPLAYQVVPPTEEQAVADALLELLPADPAAAEFGIYGFNWVLAGLGQAGRIDDAVDLIRLFWGYMLEAGATTWWERFDAQYSYAQSLSHGWGSSPTWFLSQYILGAQRTGTNSWVLAPDFDSVTQVSGAIPLQEGVLAVAWRNATCTTLTISLTAPSNAAGTVVIPWVERAITLDGIVVWGDAQASTELVSVGPAGVMLSVDGGQHEIEIEKNCLITP